MTTIHSQVFGPWIETLQKNADASLPAYVRNQRWFRSKQRKIKRFDIQDSIVCEEEKRFYILLLVRFHFEEGEPEVYFIPLIGVIGDIGEKKEQVVLSFQVDSSRYTVLDAFKDKSFGKWLFVKIGDGAELASGQGRLKFHPRRKDFKMNDLDLSQIRSLTAEQSNTSLVARDEYILKVYRKPDAGINPEVEMLDFLKRNHYTYVPQLAADIVYESKGEPPSSLALMVGFIKASSDGWGYVVEELKNVYPQFMGPEFQESVQKDLRVVLKNLLQNLYRIGQLTAELHRTLAGDSRDERFSPEAITKRDLEAWKGGYFKLIDQVTGIVKKKADFRSDSGKRLQELIGQEERLKSAASSLSLLCERDVRKIRYHGDYHLGQVLKGPEDWMLFDFEGEPLRSLEERKQKACVLKDVAGMLRSFSYAAAVSSTAFIQQTGAQKSEVDAVKEVIEEFMREEFLRGYFDSVLRRNDRGSMFLCPDRADNEAVLFFYELDKAVYELNYEINNRPGWIDVPLDGIQRLLKQPE
ncbi:MAG: hypothetical protein Q8R76_01285 [Candidatus Omnitrophota bacterium]|nr:hypothetical protein [Candidatus Omnitrophota bacterium]